MKATLFCWFCSHFLGWSTSFRTRVPTHSASSAMLGGQFVLLSHHIRVTAITRAGSLKVGTLSSPHHPGKSFPLVSEREAAGVGWGVTSGPHLDSVSFTHLCLFFIFFIMCWWSLIIMMNQLLLWRFQNDFSNLTLLLHLIAEIIFIKNCFLFSFLCFHVKLISWIK